MTGCGVAARELSSVATCVSDAAVERWLDARGKALDAFLRGFCPMIA
jgi:hypothetical protein